VTLKEIAKLANVSQGTVDRVVHERGRVSPKTREKILKILKEVNYQPNIYARGLVLNKSYTIAALLPEFEEGEYWELPTVGVLKAARELGHFGINLEILAFDQNSVSSFAEQANQVLKMKPDGVIIAPVINFEAIKLATKLKELKIPFNIIDSRLDIEGALSFVGQDAFQSGKLAAKLLSAEIQGSGIISIISIKNNENHNKTLQKRIDGFKSYFYDSELLSNITLKEHDIDERSKDWITTLSNACSRPNTRGIFVPSSKVHYVARVLEEKQMDIKLVGHDLITNNMEYVKKGVIDYIIGQRPEHQGYIALDDFYKSLIGKTQVTGFKYLPLDIVTKENLMYYHSDLLGIKS
tara:strand:- start:1104 stop:2159 length:1056 start_codon:yes stop_codon:yes gene_type:complete